MSSSSTDDSLSGKCFGIGVSDSLAESSFDTDTSDCELFWGGDYSQRYFYLLLRLSSCYCNSLILELSELIYTLVTR
jgi:hypothetical protein